MSTLLLTGCVDSVKPSWRTATPRDMQQLQKPGETTLKGRPSVLGLSWTASPSANRATLKAAGLRLRVTRRIEGGETIEVHEGSVYGREARVITTTRGQLRRVVVHWPTGQDIHRDYQTIKRVLEAEYGKSPSLFMPDPPTDTMYRAHASRKQTPITGWVFEDGWAMGLTISRPYRQGGDSSVVMELSLDSRDWRIEVGTFTQPE